MARAQEYILVAQEPFLVAKKLIRVNVSDIIAKGITPKFCLLNLSLGRNVDDVWINNFMKGIDSDLNFFDLIVPCGITDRGVTSISKELGRKVELGEVKPILRKHLSELFGWKDTAGLESPDIC